ncbi:MAG: hypothetical protein EPO06_01560 [Burkholderiaceae bacterium]|nr:MAG: hypothetical protein EPO06_01560 [Burkholderiaceae bacterium]
MKNIRTRLLAVVVALVLLIGGFILGWGVRDVAEAGMDTTTAAVGLADEALEADAIPDDPATRQAIERALYSQPALLDAALADIKPHDPKRINLYLLAVAGDGSQEVFRREVTFVKNQFDHDFGTQGRSVALINSRSTADTAPMATRISLRTALQKIAERMDKEHDILFLFLTSHGSRQHELTLNQGGVDLPDLRADELGALLHDSGIRWKVVLISACYSGGFIDPLKDDHTLIITAARGDRTSFGCADENDFTYFGRAFFKEALPQSQSFPEAFEKASTLVDAWEKEDAKEAGPKHPLQQSLPQMVAPTPVTEYLQRWRAQSK